HCEGGISVQKRDRDHFRFTRSLFVCLKRGQFYLRLARVGAVDGFAVMTQGFLSEPFRVAALFGTFGPRVTVTMERDTLHPCAPASPLKEAGPMFLVEWREAR